MKQEHIIDWNIKESKKRIKNSILKDNILIFFTRVIEDLNRYKNPNFYGRIKDLFFLIYPYSNIIDTKKIFLDLRKSDLKSKNGLTLNENEINHIKFFINELDECCKLKNTEKAKINANATLTELVKKYLPNSSVLIEPYLLGKLISSVGGIKNLSRKPSSTIQLIGAEKAMFRHIRKNRPSPKYGLIYYSDNIQKTKNKGKASRRLANKLALNIRVDYFKNFAQ